MYGELLAVDTEVTKEKVREKIEGEHVKTHSRVVGWTALPLFLRSLPEPLRQE
jgi:hypothetical protein